MREASRRLKINPDRVRGMVDALGITLTPVGKALVMNEDDFRKLKRRVDAMRSGRGVISVGA